MRVVICGRRSAHWYLQGEQGFHYSESEEPTQAALEQGMALTKALDLDSVDGNPYELIRGSSSDAVVRVACPSPPL